ncbi:MAG: hypothetical protein I4E98_21605, partial [Planktothrix agardhii KL2]
MESSSKKLVSQSIKTLDSILIDEKLPPSERATVALKILEMARTFAPETPPASETQPIPIRKLNFTAPKIFLHLAAYRDSELIPTLKDALKKAHRPEKITFGIVWQFIPGEDENITGKIQEFPCKMIEIDARQSLGVCWARSMGQRLLHDEDFILQLDSHHRFVEGWDSLLLKQLAQCPSPKPILSAYT